MNLDLSLVIPVYNEAESLATLIAEVHSVLSSTSLTYEIICVDDGSRDRSFELLQQMSQSDARLVVCQFRRNFGQTAAIQAGLDAARGSIVVTMDADLQNDPADIPRMVTLVREGYDVVVGWRHERKDAFLSRRLPSKIANWLISHTTGVHLHDYGCTLKALSSDVAKEMRLYGEMHRFIPAIASWIGVELHEVKVNHRERQHGQSKYGIGRTLRVVLDLITVIFLKSYLVRPMQVFGLAGAISGAIGTSILAGLTIAKLIYHVSLANRPLLYLGILLVLVGIQLLSLGLIADVLARTYHESQGRRAYHVRRWINNLSQSDKS